MRTAGVELKSPRLWSLTPTATENSLTFGTKKKRPCTHWPWYWVVPRVDKHAVKRKTSCYCRGLKPSHPAHDQSLYWLIWLLNILASSQRNSNAQQYFLLQNILPIFAAPTVIITMRRIALWKLLFKQHPNHKTVKTVETKNCILKFGTLTAVTMKATIFCDNDAAKPGRDLTSRRNAGKFLPDTKRRGHFKVYFFPHLFRIARS
jgi:hypothetical protein